MTTITTSLGPPLRNNDIRRAPLLAASIFLDILNSFFLTASLFSGDQQAGRQEWSWTRA
jgi:hypothetical protein